MELQVGIKGTAEMVVTEDKTAAAVGSGAVRVFATPWMCAIMELAACNALSPYMEPGQGSVGTKLSISHDAATPVGMKATAEAELIEVDRRRLVFAVTAYDDMGPIGKARERCSNEEYALKNLDEIFNGYEDIRRKLDKLADYHHSLAL